MSALNPALRRIVPAGIGVLGAYQMFQGVLMAVAPATFYERIGPFGPLNEHYVRDAATWSLAYGGALLLGVSRPSWRVPLLSFGVAEFALHLVNHIIDVGAADPAWVGVFDAVALAILCAAIAVLLYAARADEVGR